MRYLLLFNLFRRLINTDKRLSQNVSVYYLARHVLASLPSAADPEKEQHEQARLKAAANLRRLDRMKDGSSDSTDADVDGKKGAPRPPRKEDLVLNQYESQIAMEVVAPEDIPVGFEGEAACLDVAEVLQLTVDRYWRFGRYY